VRVGDLRVFKPYAFYANDIFVVTYVDDMDCSITIRIIKTGQVECWDRIILLHDSKSVSDKKCP